MAALAEFLGDDEKSQEQANRVMKAFDRGAGMINALEFLVAVILASEGKREEKAELIFDCFDFGGKSSMSYDELTILILCFTRALGILTGLKGESDENFIESITGKTFQTSGRVEKAEYVKFVKDDIGAFDINNMSKETLQSFGVKQPELVPVPEGEAEEKEKQALAAELEAELEQKLAADPGKETKDDLITENPKVEPSPSATDTGDKEQAQADENQQQLDKSDQKDSPPDEQPSTQDATAAVDKAGVEGDNTKETPSTKNIVDGDGNTVVVGTV